MTQKDKEGKGLWNKKPPFL